MVLINQGTSVRIDSTGVDLTVSGDTATYGDYNSGLTSRVNLTVTGFNIVSERVNADNSVTVTFQISLLRYRQDYTTGVNTPPRTIWIWEFDGYNMGNILYNTIEQVDFTGDLPTMTLTHTATIAPLDDVVCGFYFRNTATGYESVPLPNVHTDQFAIGKRLYNPLQPTYIPSAGNKSGVVKNFNEYGDIVVNKNGTNISVRNTLNTYDEVSDDMEFANKQGTLKATRKVV